MSIVVTTSSAYYHFHFHIILPFCTSLSLLFNAHGTHHGFAAAAVAAVANNIIPIVLQSNHLINFIFYSSRFNPRDRPECDVSSFFHCPLATPLRSFGSAPPLDRTKRIQANQTGE